jgi:antitoxin (DNA-binding transcriptional repressor) of toxin-antitoxin stability system
LRNEGGSVIERILGGEHLTITRDGVPVAELRPLRRRGLDAEVLLERFRHLPPMDPEAFRADVDRFIDQSL